MGQSINSLQIYGNLCLWITCPESKGCSRWDIRKGSCEQLGMRVQGRLDYNNLNLSDNKDDRSVIHSWVNWLHKLKRTLV